MPRELITYRYVGKDLKRFRNTQYYEYTLLRIKDKKFVTVHWNRLKQLIEQDRLFLFPAVLKRHFIFPKPESK